MIYSSQLTKLLSSIYDIIDLIRLRYRSLNLHLATSDQASFPPITCFRSHRSWSIQNHPCFLLAFGSHPKLRKGEPFSWFVVFSWTFTCCDFLWRFFFWWSLGRTEADWGNDEGFDCVFFCSLLTLTEVGKDHHYTFIFISKFHDYFAGVFGLLCQSQSLFNSLSSGPSYHWVMMFFFSSWWLSRIFLCQPLQLQRLLIGSVTFTYDIPLNPISHCA